MICHHMFNSSQKDKILKAFADDNVCGSEFFFFWGGGKGMKKHHLSFHTILSKAFILWVIRSWDCVVQCKIQRVAHIYSKQVVCITSLHVWDEDS